MSKLRVLSFIPHVLAYGVLCWVQLVQKDDRKATALAIFFLNWMSIITIALIGVWVGVFVDRHIIDFDLETVVWPLLIPVLLYMYFCQDEPDRIWFGVVISPDMCLETSTSSWFAKLSVVAYFLLFFFVLAQLAPDVRERDKSDARVTVRLTMPLP